MTRSHKTCFNISGQGFKKTLFAINAIFFLVKIALIANRVFFHR